MEEAYFVKSGNFLGNQEYKGWYLFYNQSNIISHQVGDQLEMPEMFGMIPWRHHVEIIVKCKNQ